MALLDNGTMNTHQMSRYLNANVKTMYTVMYQLKKDGVVETCGYRKYRLTDMGRDMAGKIIPYATDGKNPPRKVMNNDFKPSSVSVVPPKTMSGEKKGDIDWALEYIKLATKIAERSSSER